METNKTQYAKELKVDDEILKKINLANKEFRGNWNYSLRMSCYLYNKNNLCNMMNRYRNLWHLYSFD